MQHNSKSQHNSYAKDGRAGWSTKNSTEKIGQKTLHIWFA